MTSSSINRCCKSCTRKALLLLVFFWPVHPACSERVLLDGVAAHANEHVITISDVMEGMQPVRRQLTARFNGADLRARLTRAYDETLNSIVARYLVLDRYEEDERKLPEWFVEQRAENFIRETFSGDRSELMEALAKERLTYDEWRKQMEQQLIVTQMRTASVSQYINVSPENMREYYNTHSDEFAAPKTMSFRMIMLRKDRQSSREENRHAAVAVLNRLQEGEDFSVVARQVSEGVHADEGGDWGWVEPKILKGELVAAIGTLQPGEISELIETEGEHYVLKLEGRRESSLLPFREAQPLIESTLRREYGEKLYDEWIERLRRNAYVRVFDIKLFSNR